MTRHNEVRDILSDSLRDICSEVTVEPSLFPFTGEQFQLRSASGPLTVRRGSTSLQADSLRVGLNEHFLTSGFLAPSPVLTKAPSTLSTAAKSKRSAENMVNEYVSQSMHHLYLWFSPALLVLDLLQQPS